VVSNAAYVRIDRGAVPRRRRFMRFDSGARRLVGVLGDPVVTHFRRHATQPSHELGLNWALPGSVAAGSWARPCGVLRLGCVG